MNYPPVYITGMGIISPLGIGCPATLEAITRNEKKISPLCLFSVAHGDPLPVGQILTPIENDTQVPRTHQLALIAAREALNGHQRPPDAIVIGCTTGGMPDTEDKLISGADNPDIYCYHATGSVGDHLAMIFNCRGPVLTVSTACSSGTATFKIALELLRSGAATRVLAGGVDALCRLTYYGFNALQLIDPTGPKPFDRHRRGMAVAEAAAMLLLESARTVPKNALAQFLGAGLSCDAYHPTAPHPRGDGALAAMTAAIADAGISTDQIDYIHLHGTGTTDNDAAEAMAIDRLFSRQKPAASSIKGSTGHSLAAAGAVGAVISVLSIRHDLIPANTGMTEPDTRLPLSPISTPAQQPVRRALVNSLGFGGNNAAAVFGKIGSGKPVEADRYPQSLSILAKACLTGAGDSDATETCFRRGKSMAGQLSTATLSAGLSVETLRRLKRLPRMVLSLCETVRRQVALSRGPGSIYLGTGWGALTETHRFLTQLFESDQRFASPIDFSGSIHNAPAGQAAMFFNAVGPNLTLTGGDYSFEQALFTASLLTKEDDQPCIVIGADEYHPDFSPLFDPSCRLSNIPADGGAAFCLQRTRQSGCPTLRCLFYAQAGDNPEVISRLVAAMGDSHSFPNRYGAVLYGIPKCCDSLGNFQLKQFNAALNTEVPCVPYRSFTGEFATASAVATSLAVTLVQDQTIPTALTGIPPVSLDGRGVLILGLGTSISAVLVSP